MIKVILFVLLSVSVSNAYICKVTNIFTLANDGSHGGAVGQTTFSIDGYTKNIGYLGVTPSAKVDNRCDTTYSQLLEGASLLIIDDDNKELLSRKGGFKGYVLDNGQVYRTHVVKYESTFIPFECNGNILKTNYRTLTCSCPEGQE